MTPALLTKVDALVEKMGQSRVTVINMAVYRAVEHRLSIGWSKLDNKWRLSQYPSMPRQLLCPVGDNYLVRLVVV